MTASRWLIRSPAAVEPTLRLICLPYAGGGASLFRNWRTELPDDVEVVAVQLPGRETRMREPAIARMGDLLPPLVEALRPVLAEGYGLFGHSMGALIAFALARELRRLQLPAPLQLWVSGHRAPQLPRQRRPLHDLPQTEFIDELRRLDGTPEEVLVHPELMELLIPRLRADFAVCETWQYQQEPPLDCPLTAYAGRDDALDHSRLSAWSGQTNADFSQRLFDGGHFFLHGQRSALLAALSADIARLRDRTHG